MNSLLLGLALTTSPSAVAQPPVPGFRPVPIVRPVPVLTPPVFVPAPPSFYPPARPHRGAVTLDEFARCFVPTPGTHHVWIVHPVTCRPVEVCFRLPHGCGRPRIDVDRRSIEFDYGKREVEITFLRNGRVDVDY